MADMPWLIGDDATDTVSAYEHYAGRVFAASQVITKRVAGRPILVARVLNGTNKRSIKSRNSRGEDIQLPEFLKGHDPSRLELLDDHDIHDALENPSPYYTQWQLVSATVQNLLVTARAFWVITSNGDRLEFTWVPTSWVSANHSKRLFGEWVVRPPNSASGAQRVDAEYMAHFFFPDPQDPFGALSVVDALTKSILVDEEILKAQFSGFQNGINPSVALVAGDVAGGADQNRRVKLEPEQRRRIINWLKQQYQGSLRYGEPIVLDALFRDIKFLSNKPEEMAFLDSSNLMEAQIYMGFTVNPISAGKVEDVNRSSSAVADHHLLTNAVNPILEMMGQTLTKYVAPHFQRKGEKLKVWFQPSRPHDPQLTIDELKLLVQGRAINRNELRQTMQTINLGDMPNGGTVAVPVNEQFFDFSERDEANENLRRALRISRAMASSNGKA